MSQVGKVLSSGKLTSGDINFNWSTGNVLDSNTRDYIVVKLTGSFVMPGITGKTYNVLFRNQDDDGSRTIIGGTVVIEDWSGLHGASNRDGSISLVGGQLYSYERLQSEWGGHSVLRQFWKINGLSGYNNYRYMNIANDFR